MKESKILKLQGAYNFIDYWIKIKKKNTSMTFKNFTQSFNSLLIFHG